MTFRCYFLNKIQIRTPKKIPAVETIKIGTMNWDSFITSGVH